MDKIAIYFYDGDIKLRNENEIFRKTKKRGFSLTKPYQQSQIKSPDHAGVVGYFLD